MHKHMSINILLLPAVFPLLLLLQDNSAAATAAAASAAALLVPVLLLLLPLQDKDGVIWPWDTARGFRDIGYNPLISFLAPFFIHSGMSLPTQVRISLQCRLM